jgi:hypothetical protein
MNTLVILAIVVVVLSRVTVVYFLGPKRKPVRVAEPTLEAAWEQYVSHPDHAPARDRRAITKLDRVDAARLKGSLEQTVETALADPSPLVVLRKTIMDATDRFVLEELMGGEAEEPQTEYLEDVLRTGALRCFSMLRFQDYSNNDWYTHYLQMAGMNAGNVAGMVRKTVAGEQTSMETSLHDALTGTMRQVRGALLRYPPRTAVQRADKLTDADTPTRTYPSQQQIDDLTDLMSERFEKLFSGQVYGSAAEQPINPAESFQIDSGLLYALLALNFKHPDEGWRQIMSKALGSYADALQNEERLLETGREFHGVWLENRQRGPLDAVLKRGWETVLGTPSGTGSAVTRPLARRMTEDASILVGAIDEVVKTG